LLDADAFHHAIVAFIFSELPVWRDRISITEVTDEPNLNQRLCVHLNSAARRRSFDSVQFLQEPVQAAGRRADMGVMPLGTIEVQGRSYQDFEQLLPIECKRLPTPADSHRSDCEYVHGTPDHRTGAIERFKHGLHGADNKRALIIAYVQSETFAHWLAKVNERLASLADSSSDDGIWSPNELLSLLTAESKSDVSKLHSRHQRKRKAGTDHIDIEHLWLRMN
jgi:hypothetical protein